MAAALSDAVVLSAEVAGVTLPGTTTAAAAVASEAKGGASGAGKSLSLLKPLPASEAAPASVTLDAEIIAAPSTVAASDTLPTGRESIGAAAAAAVAAAAAARGSQKLRLVDTDVATRQVSERQRLVRIVYADI